MAKVAMMQLSSCWGCNQSLIDAHLTLLHVLPELEFVFWPAVVDFKYNDLKGYPDGSVDVGFLEGMLRTKKDHANAKLMRQKCKIIVAIGSCSCFGGIPGMANLYSIEELTSRKFEDEEYVQEGATVPDQHVPGFAETVQQLDEIVKVDAYLPGCPPKTGNIVGLIATVLGSMKTEIDDSKNMCDVCPIASACLLDKNELCYGPITAAGNPVGAIAVGKPVLGEFGLTKNANVDNANKLISKVVAGLMSKEDVNKSVEALTMLLNLTNLGYLASAADPLKSLKLDPDGKAMKDIAVSGNTYGVVDFTKEGYSDVINNVIGSVMADLIKNPNYENVIDTVCSQCDRNVTNKEVIKFKRDYEGLPDPDICLLVQGYVCMGPITKGGCGATCCRANSPCLGCYGPPLNVEDQGAKSVSYFPSLCRDTPENIEKSISDPAGVFNRFTLASSMLGKKVDENKNGGGM